MAGFSVTYEIITPASAEDGEAAEEGFVVRGVGLREAVAALHGALVAPSSSCFDATDVWYTTVDPETDLRTGEATYYALHPPRGLSRSTQRRIARLLGVEVSKS